jgi:hypothetical protein
VLSDHELQALHEIERRLRWTSPELVRLFDSVEPLPAENRRKRARARMLVASAAFAGLALFGPRMLYEAETTAQRRPPLPQISPSQATVALRGPTASEPATSVAAPVTVIDLSIGVSTTQATATCQAPARDTDTAIPSTGEPTTRSVERRDLSISIDSPQSPSRTDRDARAESESSC